MKMTVAEACIKLESKSQLIYSVFIFIKLPENQVFNMFVF